MKRYEVQINQYYVTDGYTNRESKTFVHRKAAMKYALTMHNNFKFLNDHSPKEDQFLWEIKVVQIKAIKIYGGK